MKRLYRNHGTITEYYYPQRCPRSSLHSIIVSSLGKYFGKNVRVKAVKYMLEIILKKVLGPSILYTFSEYVYLK